MKKSIATLVVALASVPGFGAEPASPIDRMAACAELTDTRQRLACFDKEIAPVKAKPAAPATGTARPATPAPASVPAAPAAPATVTAPARSAAPSLGDEQLKSKERPAVAEEENALHAKLVSIRVGADSWQLSLDNGQVWRHENAQLGSYLVIGEALTIRKGGLGNYRLTRDAGQEKNWIRVTRVK
ncbi:MAG: hypothetical protein ABW136_03175 [Steroidobacteraceae bacterium]